MNPAFWKDKRVLITGHTGFKGSWLSLWLQHLRANVFGYALNPPTKPNLFEVADVDKNMSSLDGDIRDLEHVVKVLKKYQPEIVIHMAAQSLVRYSYNNPVETYEVNVMGALNILEAIRQVNSVRSVVMVTTDKCYENKEWLWAYRENEPMGGFDPYSSSKACSELLITSYRNSFFSAENYSEHKTAIASVRSGNVVGGGDWAEDRLIPDIIRAFKNEQPVNIRNPSAVRPWQYVLEPLAGYLILAEKLYNMGAEYAEAWNFGPLEHDVKPVEWIVDYMTRTWGKNASWIKDSNEHPHEANYLKLDCSKAYTRLLWRPRWDLKFSLQKIIEWHKAEISGKSLKEECFRQIDEYLSGIKNENPNDTY